MIVVRKILAPIAALLVAIFLFAAYAHGQMPPFTAYGSLLKVDDKVEAFDGRKSCGSARADSNGNWILQISSSALCNPATGDKITFTLNGAPTSASETYKPGGAPEDVARGVTLIVRRS